jgi:non-specific serine/threonine protein kinase
MDNSLLTPHRWRRVKTIFRTLVDLDAERQERLLADLDGTDDAQLAVDVRGLLKSHCERGFVDELAERLGCAPTALVSSAPVTGRIGRYEILERIGEGGMGIVYKARDPQLDRLVALKLISPARRLDEDWRQRLIVEARAAAAIDHPCIATVYEIGEAEDGTLFLAMAFYEGETLAARVAQGPLPAPEAMRIAREIARGLAAAHARGIIHRDLKPANVLLVRSTDVKIVDFGIAKLPGVDQTQMGEVLGSIAYMAPEQRRGEPVDARADVWAFGVLLVEMLTGERITAERLYAGSLPATYPSVLSAIPHELDRIVERALAVRPSDRYPDGSALLAALEQGLEPEASARVGDRRFQVPTEAITRFFGRQPEVEDVLLRIAEARLVTLTGPGGTGKTRLAIHVAGQTRDRFEDGVVFVPLVAIVDPTLVCAEIARVLAIPERPAISPAESLASFLRSRRLLLVLDNFEHVAAAAPEILDLLTGCAHLRILVTSRVPLRVAGEHEYPVPPLSHPAAKTPMTASSLERFPATALFLDRARAVCPGLATLADEQAGAVAEICARLDGLPLAIELAAARVRVLTPQAILDRLSDQLALLAGGARDLPARQQTLRGAIAWSHDMLDEADRRAFARISVFAGGASLEQIEEVCFEPADRPQALDVVTSLLDKSLLREEAAGGVPRFRMLETIRQFAAEQLEASGDAEVLRARHATAVLAFAEEGAAAVLSAEGRTWLDRYELERDNIRAAMAWSLDGAQTETALRLVTACWRYWQIRGYLTEARGHAERALALPDAGAYPTAREQALEAAGGIAYWQGDTDAARVWYQETLDLARARGDDLTFAYAWIVEAQTEARLVAEESLAVNERLGDRLGIARSMWAIANSYYFEGNVDRAIELCEQALAMFHELGDRFMEGWSYYMRGLIRMRIAPDLVHADLAAAYQIFRATDDVTGYALVFDAFGAAAHANGDDFSAARLAGFATATEHLAGSGLGAANRVIARFDPEALRVSDPTFAAEFAAGQRMELEEAERLALGGDGTGSAAPILD